jgi:hypothetical protein
MHNQVEQRYATDFIVAVRFGGKYLKIQSLKVSSLGCSLAVGLVLATAGALFAQTQSPMKQGSVPAYQDSWEVAGREPGEGLARS